MILTDELCDMLCAAALEKSKEVGIDISFAVYDENGLPRVYRRFGEALVLSITLVPGKAYTSAVTQCRTKDVAQCAVEGGSLFAIQSNDPRILQEWGVCISLVRPCFCITSEKVCSEVDIQLLREQIAWIYFYLKEESPVFNKSAETLTALIFIHILHRYGMLKKLAGNEKKISSKNERMGVINHYITQHLAEPIALQEVAEAAGYNKTYLSSQFKQWTGFNLSDYVKQIRVQRAIGMLEEQESTLTEIAMKSGFSDYNTFSACMLQYCGRKPQDYRNRIGNDKEQMEAQRHFAKYPDDYIEQCFENFRTGSVYGEAKTERNAEKIEEYANAILKLVKQDNRSE